MPFQKGHKLAKGGARQGAGRKTNAIRALCAKAFADRVPVLGQIIDDPQARPTDKIAALALLGKTGIPSQFENVGEAPKAILWQLPPLPPS